ncbi:MAG: hypothetical protein HWN68_18335, partial [Desulfobacterales bacterium]|nr:hypothetical protein [Desulfobacterales bacterium]
PPPPPPPDEWTHKLILYYYRLPWADAASVEGAINTLLIPTLNGLEWLLGYDYVSHQHDWKGMTITVYYAARGTPVVPIWGILLAIGVLLLGVGVVIMGAAWCIAEVTKYEGFKTKSQMLKEGTITTEEYKELLAAQKENPAPWEKALGWGAIIIILLLLAGARRD